MKLLKFSLVISVSGIFFLLILTNIIEPREIYSYTDLKLNSYVKTTGKIISVKNYDDFSIIRLNNNIIVTCEKCKLKQNQTITAEGKVTEYKKELQIQAEKIKC